MYWLIFVLVIVGLCLVLAYANPLGNGNAFRPEKVRVEKMMGDQTTTAASGQKSYGDARLEKRGGLYLLHLSGSAYEMGFQHGRLLRDEIREGVMPNHAFPVYNHPPFSQLSKTLQWFLTRYYDWTIFRPLLKNAPRHFLEEIKGLADGSGLTFDLVFRGNMLSEFNMSTTSMLNRIMRRRLQNHNECTSFAAYPEMTRDGSLIMGRNTDYSGAGLWDETQTVFFYSPQDGYRYVNVGCAGLIKCNSCMNEKGLCLGGHFMFSLDVNPAGYGFTALEHEIMLKADGIDAAFEIVKRNRRAGAFAYLLADGARNEAAAIEATSSTAGLRRAENGFIIETNFMTTPETLSTDLLQEIGIAKNVVARYKRMEQLIQEHASSITPQKAAHFMGDHLDLTSDAIRPFGNVIGSTWNLTSVIFKPDDFTFWVADGLAPICNNVFIGFNMLKEFDGKPYLVNPEILEPNPYVKTASYEALRQYYPFLIKATLPPFDREDAIEQLNRMVRLIPGEVAYRLILSKLLLRSGDIQAAADQLRMMVDYALSPSEQAQVMLLLGFAYDLQDQRENASRCYQDILPKTKSTSLDHLASVNPFILADARKYLKTAFTKEHLGSIEVNFEMMSMYDR